MTTSPSGGPDLSAEDITRIAERVRQLLEGRAARDAPRQRCHSSGWPLLIDHTLLKPEATPADIQRCATRRDVTASSRSA